MFPRERHQTRHLVNFAGLLAKQVLSQLSYTPTVGFSFILKHLPPFRIPFLRNIVSGDHGPAYPSLGCDFPGDTAQSCSLGAWSSGAAVRLLPPPPAL